MTFKLLRVIRSLNPIHGGPTSGLIQSAPYLFDHNIHTTVLTLDPPDSPWLANLPFEHLAVGPAFGGYGFVFGLISYVEKLLPGFDAAIIEGLWQYHALAASLAFRRCQFPFYVYPHGMLDPWFNQTYPLKRFKKSLYWLIADYQMLKNANGILYTSKEERDASKDSFKPYSGREYVIGYGACDPPKLTQIQRNLFFQFYPSLRGKEIFLFLGRIHPKKGVDLLIRAFASLAPKSSDYHLVIAGPSSRQYLGFLVNLISSLSLTDRITITGPLSGNIKYSALYSASLFCLPSHQENFGVAVAEALSVGLPVCISDKVNIHQSITQYNAGLVHSNSLKATIESLTKWSLLDSAIRENMSSAAISLFRSCYCWSVSSVVLSNLLKQTTKATPTL